MPENSTHREYDKRKNEWTLIRDCKAGESAIKKPGTVYCPALSGQTGVIEGYKLGDNLESEYSSYIGRGVFYNALGRTIQGMVGVATRKAPVLEGPTSLKNIEGHLTKDGLSFSELVRETIEQVLSYARFGILIDIADEDNSIPVGVKYNAESIYNWRTQIINGEELLTMLALKETALEPKTDDQYVLEEKDQMRILTLTDQGVAVKVFQKQKEKADWLQVGTDIFPKNRGKVLTRIPFEIFGPVYNVIKPDRPPFMDLAFLNIGHWRNSVDYEHGLHWCGVPTPWAAGFNVKDGDTLQIGSKTAWIADDPEASCGFLEFTGQGLDALKEALEAKERQMAVMGSRMLEEQKKAVEAEETHKIRKVGENATLSSIVGAVELGMNRLMKSMALYTDGSDNEVNVTLGKDFVSQKLTPQELKELVGAVQANTMSIDTFLYNLQQGEMLPDDTTIEDEKLRLQSRDNKEFKQDE